MIISLSGPSGIGKGFVKERLLQLYPHIQELKWFTTRPLRPNEQDGNRIRVSLPQFSQLVEFDKLVLVQDLFGHRYGLRKEDLIPSSNIRLTELHPDNLLEALGINPMIFAIGFVTFDLSLLHKRLSVLRKTESPAEIEKRVAMAASEIETILRQRSLFASVIEVTEARETLLLDEVLTVLASGLTKKGERPCLSRHK
jgi:guanylate kinase